MLGTEYTPIAQRLLRRLHNEYGLERRPVDLHTLLRSLYHDNPRYYQRLWGTKSPKKLNYHLYRTIEENEECYKRVVSCCQKTGSEPWESRLPILFPED